MIGHGVDPFSIVAILGIFLLYYRWLQIGRHLLDIMLIRGRHDSLVLTLIFPCSRNGEEGVDPSDTDYFPGWLFTRISGEISHN